jgi:hypothetical protein
MASGAVAQEAFGVETKGVDCRHPAIPTAVQREPQSRPRDRLIWAIAGVAGAV